MSEDKDSTGVKFDNLASMQPFKVKGDLHSLAERWKKWRRSFNWYVASKGLADEKQMKCLLLHSAG